MPTFVGGAWWPERRTWSLANRPLVQQHNPYPLGTVTKKVAVIVQAPRTGTLTGFSILLGQSTELGLPPSPSIYRFSIQGLDADGHPDGDDAALYDVPGNVWPDFGWLTADLVEGYPVTRGELLACVTHFYHEGNTASASWMASMHPNQATQQAPPWGLTWSEAGGWTSFTPVGFPPLVLHYEDPDDDGPPSDLLPIQNFGRTVAPWLVTSTAVGMHFTVPRALLCDALAFNCRPTTGAHLALSGGGVSREGTIAASAAFDNWIVPFEAVVLMPGVTYTVTLVPLAGDLTVAGYLADADAVADFEGGPTWQAFGDPVADFTTRWFFSLRIPGTLDLATVAPIAGCSTTFGPEPCDPTCPPDPPGLTPDAIEIRAAFTSALWFLGLGVAPPPGTAAPITGCGATFMNDPCGGLAPPATGPATCEAPLGLFVLGATCLGEPTSALRRMRTPARSRHVAR